MRKTLSAVVMLACGFVAFAQAPVKGDDWMFGRSYYSHGDRPRPVNGEVATSRSAFRQPFVGAHPKFAIRGGWRYNNINIPNGNGSDSTTIRENWFDLNY